MDLGKSLFFDVFFRNKSNNPIMRIDNGAFIMIRFILQDQFDLEWMNECVWVCWQAKRKKKMLQRVDFEPMCVCVCVSNTDTNLWINFSSLPIIIMS